LVNNAGVFPGLTTAATTEATFDEVYAVNVIYEGAPFVKGRRVVFPARLRPGGA